MQETTQVNHANTEDPVKDRWFSFPFRTFSGGPIPDEEVRQIVREFQGNLPTIRTRSVWFDRDLIEQLYLLLKDSSKKYDGIRLYIGKYPVKAVYKDVSTRQGPKDYRLRVSLVIIPTIDNNDGTSRDDIDWDKVDDITKEENVDKLTPIKQLLAAYNHGELCPPNKGCRS